MSGEQSGAMAKARQHLDRWRKEHGGRGVRIPDEFWREAVGVARTNGLWQTARELRLEYGRLKARVGAAEGREVISDGPGTTFVELGVGHLGGSRTVVEFVGRDGDRMRIDVTGPSAVDVVGVSRAFWSRQA